MPHGVGSRCAAWRAKVASRHCKLHAHSHEIKLTALSITSHQVFIYGTTAGRFELLCVRPGIRKQIACAIASCLHIQPTAFICPVRSIRCCRWKCSATRPSHAAYNGERAPNFVHGACVTCARCELQGSGHSWLLYVCTWIHSQHLACFSIVMDTLMCAIV